MKTIETTLGPLPLDKLGKRINAHDHLFLDSGPGGVNVPDFLLDDVDKTSVEIQRWAEAGGGAIVDTMPTTGRNVDKCIEVSLRTGVPIIMSTGFHKGAYYWPDHWRYFYDEEELFELILAEIKEGIERSNYRGPFINRSPVKAAVMKVAGEYNRVTDNMKKLIGVVGRVHQETGTPVYAHTEHGTAAMEILDLLEESGVAMNRVLICHLDRNPDLFLHKEVLARGPFLEYDTPSRFKYQPESIVIDLMRSLIGAGYGDRLMLGGDMARRSYLKAYGGGPGFEYLLTEFTPRLVQEGFTEEDLHLIWNENPRRWLAG
jgi:predicted metal-dependent phosphotriesterase family hydrolase